MADYTTWNTEAIKDMIEKYKKEIAVHGFDPQLTKQLNGVLSGLKEELERRKNK